MISGCRVIFVPSFLSLYDHLVKRKLVTAHRVATYVLVVPVPDCLFFISVLEVDCDL